MVDLFPDQDLIVFHIWLLRVWIENTNQSRCHFLWAILCVINTESVFTTQAISCLTCKPFAVCVPLQFQSSLQLFYSPILWATVFVQAWPSYGFHIESLRVCGHSTVLTGAQTQVWWQQQWPIISVSSRTNQTRPPFFSLCQTKPLHDIKCCVSLVGARIHYAAMPNES